MSQDSYNERIQETIEEKAAKALADLPEESREQAAGVRNQLFSWLMEMDTVYQDRGELSSDDTADAMCQAFEYVVQNLPEGQVQNKAACKKMVDAFMSLTTDEQLNLFRNVGIELFRRMSKQAVLFSRQNELSPWLPTGFVVDGKAKFVAAKLGNEPYQPIGFADNEHYIGTEGSKTLWYREFAFGLMVPWHSAFKVVKADLVPQEQSDDYRISDKERENILEAIGWFEADLAEHAKAADGEARAEMEYRARESLKLARLRVPRLDRMLDRFLEANPEVGHDFEHLELSQLLLSCCEYLRLKLDDDSLRQEIEATSLLVSDQTDRRQLLIQAQVQLDNLGDEASVVQTKDLLTKLSVIVPEVADLLEEVEGDQKEGLKAAKAVIANLLKATAG